MAENNQTPTTEEHVSPEAAVLESPGDVVVDFEKINDLVKQRNAAAWDAVEQTEAPDEAEKAPEGADLPTHGEADTPEPKEKAGAELEAEQKKPRSQFETKCPKVKRPPLRAAQPRIRPRPRSPRRRQIPLTSPAPWNRARWSI